MIVHCHTCGKAVWKTPSAVARHGRQYCSRKCAGAGRNRLYTVYNNKTDMPVIVAGTVEECCKAMGVKLSSFYSLRTKCNQGKVAKWTILNEGLADESEE